jgi:pilus assembly protein CpaF
VYPSLARKGPALTVRRFPTRRITMTELVNKHKSLTMSARNFLEAAVLNRRNVMVSGGTGTGKTTLLNCLSGFIPSNERIVTIEDTAELQLLDAEGRPKEHVVTLQTRKRTSNKQAAVEIDIRELVKNALRMRPDRIVVGECRGGEALDMLKAMNTGHDGSLTTLHANSTHDAILRLESMCLEANKELPVSSIRQMIASAVDLVVQLRAVMLEVWDADKNDGTGAWVRRKAKLVTEIAELEGVGGDGNVIVRPLFTRRGTGPLRPTGALPSFFSELLADPKVRDLLKSPLDLVRETAGAA